MTSFKAKYWEELLMQEPIIKPADTMGDGCRLKVASCRLKPQTELTECLPDRLNREIAPQPVPVRWEEAGRGYRLPVRRYIPSEAGWDGIGEGFEVNVVKTPAAGTAKT
jgi:hypothetical protein